MVDADEEVISDSLRTRVFHASKDGMAIALYDLLADLSSKTAEELLAQLVEEEDGQRSTPLIIAARNGHDKVVKLLISRFRINLEQEGVVKFDGFKVEGATALWCASGAGHLKVVKTLVKSGADVDHPTKTNSTPLRAACFDGRLDIVRYLAEHNANVHTTNKYNNTCLMVASYRGHGDVVSYLLEKGSDPNVRAQCGATVLHFAAECGQLSIVKELLRYGAVFSLNENGMSPLMVAADRTREDVVDYLIQQDFVSFEERIDALELLGASFANDKDNYSPTSAYTHMKRGMELRFKNKINPILKKLGPPIRAYEYWVEAQNMEEMMARASDVNSIHMESLAIRERILGPNNPEVTHPIIYRGAVFADHAQFDRCIELWMHAVNLRQNTNTSVVKDLLRFAQVFSQMIHVGVDIRYSEVESVMIACVKELENNKSKIADPGPKDDIETIQEEMETNLVTMLYLLCISNKLLISYDSRHEYYQSLNKIAFQANRVNARTRLGETLLHLCVNADTPLDDFHINDVCKFPCAVTAKLLIQTGADVNAMDKNRNTPLHAVAGRVGLPDGLGPRLALGLGRGGRLQRPARAARAARGDAAAGRAGPDAGRAQLALLHRHVQQPGLGQPGRDRHHDPGAGGRGHMATGDGRGTVRGTLRGPHHHHHHHLSLFGTVRGVPAALRSAQGGSMAGTLRSMQGMSHGGTVRGPVRGSLHGTVRGPHFLPGSNEFTAPHRSSSMLLLPGQESISYM